MNPTCAPGIRRVAGSNRPRPARSTGTTSGTPSTATAVVSVIGVLTVTSVVGTDRKAS